MMKKTTMKKPNLTESITVRFTKEQLKTIENCAVKSGTTTSQFCREVLFSDEQIIILSEGSEIAKALSELHIAIRDAVIHDKVHTLDQTVLMDKLEEVSAKFSEIMEQITPLSAFDENEEGGEE